MRKLLLLAGGTLALALVLALALRSRPAGVEESAPAALPRADAVVDLGAEGLEPYRVQVPKDHEVHLLVRGGPDCGEGMLSILGYEDRTAPVDVGPGLSREIVFESTRPGDDFGFSFSGKIVGRLEVTGSHLEAGHQ
jgi:hypothetical protein